MKDPKREYLDYWYSLSGNLGCTKSFGLKVWMEQQKKIDELESIISKMKAEKAELTEAHINESFKLNNLK